MKIKVIKEIRFAVVMYGGVSLAIYINGVAQELLRMVRATAVKSGDEETEFLLADEELDKGERIYRDLAFLLAEPELLNEYAGQIEANRNQTEIRQWMTEKISQRSDAKIVRFVVDILSGSSAGGINAIYLSKALISGQDIKNLRELWVTEGDFSQLLYDEESVKGIKVLDLATEPPSLFNSQRMYFKLLEAFKLMDEARPRASSMIDEMDLFITTTDFWGLPIPVRLFDKLIHERNHRRRLHFRYRRDQSDDFAPENYPFLAYAARCTSSFPIAFDPMRLSDTETVLNKAKMKLPANWSSYFPEERIKQKEDEKQVNWKNRVFVDGGTLDNKPFGYAIEALAQRQSSVLIDRKLIYIEPKPDLDGGKKRTAWSHRPDALTNTFNIVSALPGYETIREDLQQVLERNRLIGRVNYIVSNARKDEYRLLSLVENRLGKEIIEKNSRLAKIHTNKEWSNFTLAQLALEKGQAVYPYYRLRMSAVTEDLARMATRRAGFDDASDYFLAIRSLVRAWRLKNYNKDENNESGQTIPAFLYDYDINYRMRRLRFVLQEADKLLAALDKLKVTSFADLPEASVRTDKFAADLKLRRDLSQNLRMNKDFLAGLGAASGAAEILRQRFPLIESEMFEPSEQTEIPSAVIFAADKEKLRPVIRHCKKRINAHLKRLESGQQLIETRGTAKEFLTDLFDDLNEKFSAVAEKISVADLAGLIEEGADQTSTGDFDLEAGDIRGRKFLDERKEVDEGINEIAAALRKIYNRQPPPGYDDGAAAANSSDSEEDQSLFGKARQGAEESLSPKASSDENSTLEKNVRGYLWHFYKNFDNYDQIIFPITFETPIGEGDLVEIARISPADAVSLIDENETGRKKLAGDAVFSFSAFFKKEWRENDIMWGRLDAAERLIKLISTGSDLSAQSATQMAIITGLQKVILKESLNNVPDKTDKDDNWLIERIQSADYRCKLPLENKLILPTTNRALTVATKVLRSPVESDTNAKGEIVRIESGFWLKTLASILDFARLITDKSLLKTYFSLLILPFRFTPRWLGLLLALPFWLLHAILFTVGVIIVGVSSSSEALDLWATIRDFIFSIKFILALAFAFIVSVLLCLVIKFWLRRKITTNLAAYLSGE
jgi:patatin-related protein